ncbi:MAG: flagellar hook capping FlgD N-terminal domain-containing protein [Pikeienuella sp.]|uniref:flagellar hook capping FlgD N-terminal domain-containing protein n=1 Tax=Pikeienuella sp. TaxID=2831957 RepID=UPI003918A68D
METAAITGLTQGTASQTAASEQAAQSDALRAGGDFETFLTLLTAQLRNQDPLNPQESTEFVAQLAQFSAVEQQVRSNETLSSILSALGGTGAGALAPWLGREVEAPSALAYSGAPLEMKVDPAPGATGATLVVKTESGLTVARLPVDPTATTLTWSGETGGAAPAEAGTYRFTLERVNGKDAMPPETPRGFSTVVEARTGESGVDLVLENGDVVEAGAVRAIREPDSGA